MKYKYYLRDTTSPRKLERKFAEIFASQGAPPVSTTPVANLPPVSTTLAAKLPPVSMTPEANCQRYQGHRRQILPPVSLVLLEPVANLPPVSTIPAANLPPVSTTPVANNGTISGCRYLKVNLKAKIYIYVISTIQRCPNKIIIIFLITDFLHLPPVSLTPVVNLELRIYQRIFEKIRNGLMVYSVAWGKLIHEKNQKSKISWHCPFKQSLCLLALPLSCV